VETELLLHLVKAIDRIETKLATLDKSIPEQQWLSSEEFCTLAGITRPQLKYAIQKGRIHGAAIQNTSTGKRPTFRFNRTLALDQYLNKTPVQSSPK